MTAEIIPFDFEEQAVRVVMRDGQPWFVAKDVCGVLELSKYRDAISRLDDDERVSVLVDTLGGQQTMAAINESGLYALVLTSRKPEAKRFRKWITAEVLPAIRRTGRYEHALARPESEGEIAGMPIREAELWLAMVREARLSRGSKAAVAIWDRSPLPQFSGGARPDPREGRACLMAMLDATGDAIGAARAGDADAAGALALDGLRARAEGLFVANFALPCLAGTRWAGGMHRAAILSLPGVLPYHGVLSLAMVSTRGLIVPWAAFDAALGQEDAA